MSPPDLLVLGRVATLRGRHGGGWVEGLAIGDGRVVAAGGTRTIAALAGPRTRTIRLAPDEVAMPGLTDAHLHLVDTALADEQVALERARRLEDGLARIAAAHADTVDEDRWLEGHGWDAHRWGGWPTAGDLERVAPGRRIALWAHDHHALWVSVPALEAAGIGPARADPPGGYIRRDATGRPSGILHETAAGLVASVIPPPTLDRIVAAVARFTRDLVAAGIVAVHDPGMLTPDPQLRLALPAYARLVEAGQLPLRVHASIRQDGLESAIARGLHSGDPIGDPAGGVRVGWLKLFADGTLGSRTAAMLEPFAGSDDPAGADRGRGLFLAPPDELTALAGRAAREGIATQIHAIGDAGVRAALTALTGLVERTRLAPRIEHAQLVAAADVPRFAAAGIAASVQPIHLRTDADEALEAWGERAGRDAYRWRSLASTGLAIPFGTDAPVEPWGPWPGIELAVTRRDPDRPGTTLPGPAERLSLGRALRAACVDAATVAGEPDRGRLTRGSRADLLVIPAAALRTPVEAGGPLGRVRPRLVLIGGEIASGS